MGQTCGGVDICCAKSGNEVSELLTVDNKVRIKHQPVLTKGLSIVRLIQLHKQGCLALQEEYRQNHNHTSFRSRDIDSKEISEPIERHEFTLGLHGLHVKHES